MHPLEAINKKRTEAYKREVNDYLFMVFKISNIFMLIWTPILLLSIIGTILSVRLVDTIPTLHIISMFIITALVAHLWDITKNLTIRTVTKKKTKPEPPTLLTGWHFAVYDHLQIGNYIVPPGDWIPSPDTIHDQILEASIKWIESLQPGGTNFSIKVTPRSRIIETRTELSYNDHWISESQRGRYQEPITEATETHKENYFDFEIKQH